MFKVILVPLDAGEPAQAALELAIKLAGAVNGRLVLVSAVDVAGITIDTAGAFVDPRPALDAAREAADKALEEASQQAKAAGVAAEVEVLDGEPIPSVLDAAREHEAELIVMGSHGRSGIAKAFLGSVTDGVLRKATIPVLVVRSPRVAAHH